MNERIFFRTASNIKFNSDNDRISFNRFVSEMRKNARKEMQNGQCVICKNNFNSFCKSHSLPRFVLNEIAKDGLVKRGIDFAFKIKNDSFVGVSNALVFYNICNGCDSKCFKEYEDSKYLSNKVTDIFINEVAIKNELRFIYKRETELRMCKESLDKWNKAPHLHLLIPEFAANLKHQIEIKNIDLFDHKRILQKLLKNKDAHQFYVIDEIDLKYKTKLAYQGFITIVSDFDGNIINDIYNLDKKYLMQQLGVCIFPYNSSTKIILFCKDGDNRMRLFYKPYKKLNLNEKLYVINYMLMLFEEEWCVSKDFNETLLNEETKTLINTMADIYIETDNLNISESEKAEIIRNHRVFEKLKLQKQGPIFNFLLKY